MGDLRAGQKDAYFRRNRVVMRTAEEMHGASMDVVRTQACVLIPATIRNSVALENRNETAQGSCGFTGLPALSTGYRAFCASSPAIIPRIILRRTSGFETARFFCSKGSSARLKSW